MRYVLALAALFFLSTPALAQEKMEKLDSPEYHPDYCQFTANFPEEPFKTHRCESEDKNSCYDLISYTKVFDLSTTIRIEIICNPSKPEIYDYYTEDAMKATVKAMTKDTAVETYEISSRQADGYRQAGMLGKGQKGLDETIYIAQLWVADKSVMSVEAELSGAQTEESDRTFAEILRNIGFAKEINAPAEAQAEPSSGGE